MDTSNAAIEVDTDVEQIVRNQERDAQNKGKHTATATERTALLSSQSSTAEEDDHKADYIDDFAGLPWYRRPNVFWMLGPFFLIALAFGGIMAPKLNLIQELICRQYFADRRLADPAFAALPIDFNDGDNDQCRSDDVSERATIFLLYVSLISGVLAAITSPKLGALSDKWGRKPILLFTSIGAIFSEIITIVAATHPETFPVRWLLVGYAIDGLTGSFIVSIAMANSYAADCTPPLMRNKTFAYFHGCLFAGIAIGPILAGYVVKLTGSIVTVFYILLGVHCSFILFVAFVVPESLSKRRLEQARARQKTSEGSVFGFKRNIVDPLRIFWPTGRGASRALRRNLLMLAAVDTIVFGVAMGAGGVLIVHLRNQFGWKTFETGKFISIVNTSRVICLIVVLPLLTRLVRGKPGAQKQHAKGSDLFDLSLIRVAVFFDFLGYLGYTLSQQGNYFIVSGVIAAMGGIGSPALQASLTRHIPSDQTGQLLGATALLHSLARVISPIVFNAIYAKTVHHFKQTVFVCLCVMFFLAFLLTWFIRPHVYYEDVQDDDDDTTSEPTDTRAE